MLNRCYKNNKYLFEGKYVLFPYYYLLLALLCEDVM